MLHEIIFAFTVTPILGAKRWEIHSLQLTQYSYQCAQLENPLYFVILMKNPQGNFRAYDAKTLHQMKDWRGKFAEKIQSVRLATRLFFERFYSLTLVLSAQPGRSFSAPQRSHPPLFRRSIVPANCFVRTACARPGRRTVSSRVPKAPDTRPRLR
jgi:hypothetical protein